MMKSLHVVVAVMLILFLPWVAGGENGVQIISESSSKTSNRTALIIGNSDYKLFPLVNPVNDARDISRVLKACGFDVMLRINASQRQIEDAVRSFGKKLCQGGVGLFYYAGHGMQVDNRNYLIPIGAKIESESDVKYGAVDTALILGKMEDASNGFNIVILDACRNNPFARSFRSTGGQGLAKIDAPIGSLIAYATAPGSIAADGQGRNGIYTKNLIKSIKTPGLTIEQVLKKTREMVVKETTKKQVPWESSSLMGNFYFFLDNAQGKEQIININIPAQLPGKDISTEKDDADFFLRETFNNNKQGWLLKKTNTNMAKVQYGKYVLGNTEKNTKFISYLSVPMVVEGDFVLEASMKKMAGDESIGHGLAWGQNNGRLMYCFQISSQGEYRYGKYVNNEWVNIVKPQKSSVIKRGSGVNRLQLKKKGRILYFVINGKVVDHIPVSESVVGRAGFVLTGKQSVEFYEINMKKI